MKSPPADLLKSRRRAEMWKTARGVLKKLESALPISELYVLGSFTTKKARPADVDFIVLLKTPKTKDWSVDLVIASDDEGGRAVLADAEKWMRQKYGRKAGVVRLK